eukprot:58398-Chlamydomonas_euryale.AAC.1
MHPPSTCTLPCLHPAHAAQVDMLLGDVEAATRSAWPNHSYLTSRKLHSRVNAVTHILAPLLL